MKKSYIAECIGTAILVLFGCGVAVFTGADVVPTALAFGLTIVAMAFVIGPISGCHINPAVSFAMWMSKKLSTKDMLFYCLFQVAGAIIGASLLLLIRNVYEGSATLVFIGANSAVNAEVQTLETVLVGILAEVILTFVFIFTILGVTAKKEYGNFAGVIIGLCLTFVHLLGINITGTSVNPARSIGPAVIQAIAGEGTLPLQQIYIFILAPLAGAALAVLAFKCLNKEKPEHKQAA